MKGILGRKVGMTEKFTKDGKIIPVTVVEVEPNVITQIKTKATDGYEAIQIATKEKKEKRTTKAVMGHTKKANTTPKRFLKEIRVSDASNYELGSTLDASVFEQGERVDVQGTSKGKGFAGVIKRHNYGRGPETHGSRHHRKPGSLGSMRPMRVFKGKKLPGHMGAETKTIQNLTVVEVDTDLNYIIISGNIPGPKNSMVLIKEAVKSNLKAEEFELIDYSVVEETTSEEQEVVQEEVTSEETTLEVEENTSEAEETPAEEAKEESTKEEETVEVEEETPPTEESK